MHTGRASLPGQDPEPHAVPQGPPLALFFSAGPQQVSPIHKGGQARCCCCFLLPLACVLSEATWGVSYSVPTVLQAGLASKAVWKAIDWICSRGESAHAWPTEQWLLHSQPTHLEPHLVALVALVTRILEWHQEPLGLLCGCLTWKCPPGNGNSWARSPLGSVLLDGLHNGILGVSCGCDYRVTTVPQ